MNRSFEVEAVSLLLGSLLMVLVVLFGAAAGVRRLGLFLHTLVPRLENQLAERIRHLDGLVPGIAQPLRIALLQFAPRDAGVSAGPSRMLRAVPDILRRGRQRGRLVIVIFQRQLMRKSTFDPCFAEPLAREIALLAVRSVYAATGRELLQASRPWHRLCALAIVVAGLSVQLAVALFCGFV